MLLLSSYLLCRPCAKSSRSKLSSLPLFCLQLEPLTYSRVEYGMETRCLASCSRPLPLVLSHKMETSCPWFLATKVVTSYPWLTTAFPLFSPQKHGSCFKFLATKRRLLASRSRPRNHDFLLAVFSARKRRLMPLVFGNKTSPVQKIRILCVSTSVRT